MRCDSVACWLSCLAIVAGALFSAWVVFPCCYLLMTTTVTYLRVLIWDEACETWTVMSAWYFGRAL